MPCLNLPALQALSLERETALDTWQGCSSGGLRGNRPLEERIHIVESNIEFATVWLLFIRQLAGTGGSSGHQGGLPHGGISSSSSPTHSPSHRRLRITLLDVLPPVMAGGQSQSRRARALQLKEQLAVEAVLAGIEEFECDVVTCHASRIQVGLAQVRGINAEERAERCRQNATSFVYRKGRRAKDGTLQRTGEGDGGDYVRKRMRRAIARPARKQHWLGGCVSVTRWVS